ncbi:hypothetical protein [Culicoidibacter larvae]|uniref:Uncharacterized protein n=1 Tax=Culicoidibacter larvae TaxID=2579976 RepID=A0A5R8Q8H8_9FIRM|nr:hypothetical protein [Culicoidibacter larvae]TLG71392.1 hypothetical protein FEZ08_10890 [Culicoidibacter larvae]
MLTNELSILQKTEGVVSEGLKNAIVPIVEKLKTFPNPPWLYIAPGQFSVHTTKYEYHLHWIPYGTLDSILKNLDEINSIEDFMAFVDWMPKREKLAESCG